MTMQGPATENQIRFIRKLAEERDANPGTVDQLTKQAASDLIGQLLKIRPVAKAQALVAAKPVAKVTQDGMYRTPEGTIYKVQYNKAQGDGRRCYAKRLVIDHNAIRDEDGEIVEAAHVSFVYEAGAVLKLQSEWRMSLDEAKAFGALYGTCVRCGRTLTREVSIERGMGPVCSGAFDN
jgi:hypothetical protein